MSQVKTLDQSRAGHAWRVVEAVPKKDWDEFQIQVKKLPSRIIASGLGQALAFLEAKGYACALTNALADWLHLRRPVKEGNEKRVVARIIVGDDANSDFLRFATGECLAYLQWLTRFTEARDDKEKKAKQSAQTSQPPKSTEE